MERLSRKVRLSFHRLGGTFKLRRRTDECNPEHVQEMRIYVLAIVSPGQAEWDDTEGLLWGKSIDGTSAFVRAMSGSMVGDSRRRPTRCYSINQVSGQSRNWTPQASPRRQRTYIRTSVELNLSE